MLRKLAIRKFKSLDEVDLELPRLTVLFGPNAAGKSNVLDAIQMLSRSASCRTLADALQAPIRGYPIEAFSFPPGGLPELLSQPSASFSLEADLTAGREALRYRLGVGIEPDSGKLFVSDEYLTYLDKSSEPKHTPRIEVVNGEIRLRRRSKGKPRTEPLRQGFSMLSDPRLGGAEYRAIERVREELSGWRTYYLDPRDAMRAARPPSDVRDIGVRGEAIGPFLYRLRSDHRRHFDAIRRTLRSIIPGVEDVRVDLDKSRGILDVQVRQEGRDASSRIVSEGTLRVLALCAIAVNPWSGSLIAFEEPENGVHPRRLELIARLLFSLANEERKQVLITTHSPLLCDAVLHLAGNSDDVALFNVQRRRGTSSLRPFLTRGPLFSEPEVAQALTTESEDGLFSSLMLRGLLDD